MVDMTASTTPRTVANYARDLDRALVGPARVRRGLVREARDHLVDATDAYRRAGHDEDAAASLATRDFGSLAEVVPGFQTTLAVAGSRRTAWLLAATLTIQPFLWDGRVHLVGGTRPAPEGAYYATLDIAIEYVGVALMVGAALALLATGLGNRWRFAGRRTALGCARFTMASSVALPAMAAAMVLASGQGTVPGMWLAVGLLMFLPMALTAISARRCLAACAAID